MKRNESVKNDRALERGHGVRGRGRGDSLRWTRAKYPHPDEALMAPLTLRHELNDGGCFISERKLVSPISVRAGAVTIATAAAAAAAVVVREREREKERAPIERILTRMLKRNVLQPHSAD